MYRQRIDKATAIKIDEAIAILKSESSNNSLSKEREICLNQLLGVLNRPNSRGAMLHEGDCLQVCKAKSRQPKL